jgi:hypothetical protein
MDLARAPCRAPLTARKMGSAYENVSVPEERAWERGCLCPRNFYIFKPHPRPQAQAREGHLRNAICITLKTASTKN